ncbi:protein-disulfide reductase DsbD domain-containing protein [Oceaniglobus trochenteri]|uniref:protein-disulfide reductase DsbD domain-containing protein n=1 Tax=Oceaniglobus trochenteri TaxID=2763260 RepID=UPI001CFF6CF0|nr:protein-disulfide reductase DsbD domain-containing protein [Oceaniglobus trochenteri]
MKSTLRLLALCLSLAGPVGAQTLDDLAQLQVLPGWRTAQGTHMAALRITLVPGWKTYWRAPGDAGIPAQFDWGGSDNLGAVAIHWPVPQVFGQNGYTSVGYLEQVVIPIEFTPLQADRAIALRGTVSMGVCEHVCVPVTARIAADLPRGETRKDARIVAAINDRPMTAREAGASPVRCDVAAQSDGLRLTAQVDLPPLGGDEFVVVELPGAPVWISQATTRRAGATLEASVDILPDGGAPLALDRSRLRFTLLGQRGAVDIHGCG